MIVLKAKEIIDKKLKQKLGILEDRKEREKQNEGKKTEIKLKE